MAVFAKLVSVMVVGGESLQVRALEQWYRDIPLKAERGEILDANGVLLAGTVSTYTIYARPVSCSNKELAARVLAEKLNLDYQKLYAKLNSKTSEITVKKNVDKSVVLDILSMGVTGVFISRSIQRVYPYSDFLTQVMGFTNIDCVGQTGLESYYNSYLAGRDGYVYVPSDLVGRELKEDTTYYVEGVKGATLTLTIEKNIQDSLENAIESCQLNTNAKSVSAIVMDPNTGEIKAMGTTPSFDLNNVPRGDVSTLMKLSRVSLVSDVFEPGSTFKMVTAALGLDSGKITTGYRSYCNGALMVDGQRIKCWRTKGHGSQSFTEGVASSCNCLFMNIALSVGVDYFYDGITKFGITE
ncbi:MAG: hypothetical protein IJY07_03235, partial [Clostridia bacterium]|nr:hypothetical protein [Clostridia bacterium]